MHITSEVVAEAPTLPATLTEVAFGVGRLAGGGEDEEEGKVGRGVIEHARCVADGDTCSSWARPTSMLS